MRTLSVVSGASRHEVGRTAGLLAWFFERLRSRGPLDVVVVHDGKVVEVGTPGEIRNSVDPFVRQLVDGDIAGPVQLM